MILYVQNPKDSTKNLLEFIYKFSTVAGYKINIKKSVAFLYASNELSGREIKKKIFIYNSIKGYFGKNLTKTINKMALRIYISRGLPWWRSG